MGNKKPSVCVLDASTYVGFWILKELMSRGYTIHAATQKNGRYDFLTCLCLGHSNQIQLSFLFSLLSFMFVIYGYMFWVSCKKDK